MVTLQQLDEFCARHLEKEGMPGFSVALVGPDGPVLEKGYGYRDLNKGLPMTADTVCGVASMSKSMTALAVALLEWEGKLSYNDPVHWYLPGFRLKGTPREAVQLHHLARHTTGLPPLPTLGWSLAFHNHPEPWRAEEDGRRREKAATPVETIEDIMEYIAGTVAPLGEPGEYMSYSNDGYALLSAVVDAAAGQSLEELLQQRIFTPLGMTRTVLDLDGSQADRLAGEDRTQLYVKEEGALRHTSYWDVAPPFRGCSAVKSTARDMAKYYRMLSNYGVDQGRQVVPTQVIERMVGRYYPLVEQGTYCLGLDKRWFHGHTVCEHSGGLTGISSRGGFFLGEGVAAVILCNLEDATVSDVHNAMYNYMLGLPLDEAHTWLEPADREPEEPLRYCGVYRSGEDFTPYPVRVEYREGGLYALEEGAEAAPLTFCGGTYFMAVSPGSDWKHGTVYQFLIREGNTWAARIGSRICRREG